MESSRVARSNRASRLRKKFSANCGMMWKMCCKIFGQCVQLLLMSSFLNRPSAVVASEWFISPVGVLDTDVVSVSWARGTDEVQGP
jgi:hypothetical protein